MWPTAVTNIAEGQIFVRGEAIDQLMAQRSFSEVLTLLLIGRMPSAAEKRIVDAVLVAAIDHGATSPSALAARTAASGGAQPQYAVLAGLLALSKYHGAAVEDAAVLLDRVVADSKGGDLKASADSAVKAILSAKDRVPGYGHRVHSTDPRVEVLFSISSDVGMDAIYIEAAREVENAIESGLGRHLPMNLDTAIAAVLLPFIPVSLVLPVFMASRFCGIFMQAHEEHSRMKPMRKIVPADWIYDGPGSTDASVQS